MCKSTSTHVEIRIQESQGSLEIIKVSKKSKYRNDTHYLLISTEIKSYLINSKLNSSQQETIEVRATYLGGSGSSLNPGQHVGTMGGKMDSYSPKVRLTNGSVMIEKGMQGLHIGTYLFHKIVSWAQQFDSNYPIVPISVIKGDAEGKNGIRRNKLYENSGIRFIWDGPEGVEGKSDPDLKVKDLIAYAHWPNIEKDYRFRGLDLSWQELATLRENVRHLRHSNRRYRLTYETIEKRLWAIASFLNWPAYAVAIFIGMAIGSAVCKWHGI